MSINIHPTAIVDSKAQLEAGVEVGPYSIIGPNVRIGARTKVGPHAVIEGYTTLGEDNEVFQFASVGGKPQDLKYRGEPSRLVIGSKNSIREFVTLHPGTTGGRMETTIGDGNLFMANTHVGHDCVVGNHNVFANSAALAGHVTVYNRVIVGGMVGIHQFSRIGDFAMLGGGSMVSQDIPPYCIGQGDRCHLRGINVIGLERGGFSEDDVKMVKKVYRALFSTMGKLSAKIESLPEDFRSHEKIIPLLNFIEESERGICSPAKTLVTHE